LPPFPEPKHGHGLLWINRKRDRGKRSFVSGFSAWHLGHSISSPPEARKSQFQEKQTGRSFSIKMSIGEILFGVKTGKIRIKFRKESTRNLNHCGDPILDDVSSKIQLPWKGRLSTRIF